MGVSVSSESFSLRRPLAGFATTAQPRMTRQAYHHEIRAALTVPFALALLEGGVIAVVARNVFEVGNLGFATIVAAPMFANLTSLVWTQVARGRRKVVVTTWLMAASLALVAAVGLLPVGGLGSALLVVLAVAARVTLAGVVSVRSTIWRLNFPRQLRATITTKFVLTASVILMAVPLAVGPLLDWQPWTFRIVFPLCAAVGAMGVWSFARVRVRGERRLILEEQLMRRGGPRSLPVSGPGRGSDAPRQASGRPHTALSVLREDHTYRWYMLCQFTGGAASMMAITAFTLMVVDHLRAVAPSSENTQGMLISAAVPMAVATVSMPWWSRRLDRHHIASFRVGHALTWVLNPLVMFLAAWFASLPLMYAAAAGWGFMRGGGVLAWQLGHHDFADRRLVPTYMAIHQTLTGVRGAFAPFLGTALFAGWPAIEGLGLPAFPGIGPWLFATTAALCALSWLGFVVLQRQLVAAGGGQARDA